MEILQNVNPQAIVALHIIFVITWFAALFYMPRLMIYYAEANAKGFEEQAMEQLATMQKRLWNVIAKPSMILALLFGVWMWYLRFDFALPTWLMVKLGFVVLLLFYHHITQLWHKKQLLGLLNISSQQLRYWNELATIVLIAVVFLVELKDAVSWVYGVLGILGVAICLSVAVKQYKKYRNRS